MMIPGCNDVTYTDGRQRALTSNYICTPSGLLIPPLRDDGEDDGRGLGAAVRIEAGKGQASRWHPICPSYVRPVIPTD